MQGIKRFKVDIKELSLKEKDILKKLILAAELIAPLYLKQKNNKYPGANFYPHDATIKELERASQKNPAILDPYTFVERDKSGKFIAIPYHIKFKRELKPIAKLLIEASQLSENKNFSKYLKSRAKSLLNGDYEKSEIIWLKTKTFKLGFVIGPIERYLDKLIFKKCAYQAWVGILDEKLTKEAETMKTLVLLGRRKILSGATKVDISKVGVRVDKTIIFSGLIADFMFTGTNLPNDVNLMKKYGSNLTIFKTSLEEKFKEEHYKIFKAVFEKDFQKSYSIENLYKGSLIVILLHEICHSLIRYQDAEKRLKNIFPVFDELYAYILGIQNCGTLILKGLMSEKELEAVLIMYICRCFTWWLDFRKNSNVYDYTIGSAISLNFLLENCALEKRNCLSLPSFAKLFICIDELTHILDYYLAIGSYDEVKEFIGKYKSFNVFKQFSSRLAKIR